jgi:hypothetical protein
MDTIAVLLAAKCQRAVALWAAGATHTPIPQHGSAAESAMTRSLDLHLVNNGIKMVHADPEKLPSFVGVGIKTGQRSEGDSGGLPRSTPRRFAVRWLRLAGERLGGEGAAGHTDRR